MANAPEASLVAETPFTFRVTVAPSMPFNRLLTILPVIVCAGSDVERHAAVKMQIRAVNLINNSFGMMYMHLFIRSAALLVEKDTTRVL